MSNMSMNTEKTAKPIAEALALASAEAPLRGPGRPPNATGYRTSSGVRVPSVTTITGRFKESSGLLRWAWMQGRDGLDLYEKRDRAGEVGSLAHDMIEATIHGRICELPPDLEPEQLEAAQECHAAYVRWQDAMGMAIVATEVPLVDDDKLYGGTFDALSYSNGVYSLVDWKTSKRVYPEMLIQLAAYADLLETHGIRVEEAHLLRISPTGAFAHHGFTRRHLDMASEAFASMRGLYETDRKLKRIVGS